MTYNESITKATTENIYILDCDDRIYTGSTVIEVLQKAKIGFLNILFCPSSIPSLSDLTVLYIKNIFEVHCKRTYPEHTLNYLYASKLKLNIVLYTEEELEKPEEIADEFYRAFYNDPRNSSDFS